MPIPIFQSAPMVRLADEYLAEYYQDENLNWAGEEEKTMIRILTEVNRQTTAVEPPPSVGVDPNLILDGNSKVLEGWFTADDPRVTFSVTLMIHEVEDVTTAVGLLPPPEFVWTTFTLPLRFYYRAYLKGVVIRIRFNNSAPDQLLNGKFKVLTRIDG